jgi:flavin-dependent dehydrogenase
MSSGEIAAKIAIKAVEHDTMDAHALRHYQRRWNQEFRLNLSLLSRVSKYWGRNLDYVVKFVSNDKKLLDSICKAIPSPAGIHKEKWSLARRFLVAYCKDRLGMI